MFSIDSPFELKGDQPQAVKTLMEGFKNGEDKQILLGVTGSGKTFTVANVIQRLGIPTIVISHNKTLAAQLYAEIKGFFPKNAVEYFVSYYDYYQPEAYIPQRDIFIEKDASINDQLDRLRLSTTSSLLTRDDVIVVSSVSCLYGLGSPKEYEDSIITLFVGQEIQRDEFLRKLIDLQYFRNDYDLSRGKFRARGDIVEIYPAYEETAIRIEFFGDEIDTIWDINPTTGDCLEQISIATIWPAKHFIASQSCIEKAVKSIKTELLERTEELRNQGKSIEEQRLMSRTMYDLELLKEVGYCPGIENYSRHFSGREPGERPFNIFDYFPEEFLVVIDESHVTIPQIRAMYNADKSRKETLVNHGFRLPSALDNRPMTFEEWEAIARKVIYVTATPAPYELAMNSNKVVELINRPTGLLDPEIQVRPAKGQVGDFLKLVEKRIKAKERALVTTLTKRMAEDLSEYLRESGISSQYIHSEVNTFERVKILQDLRKGVYDVIVGVNLLREGLDLPEVSMVAIMDADKEGFLRSETALIQTIGRAARNVNAKVILYGDKMTKAMDSAICETSRRRRKQELYNKKNGIVPQTVQHGICPGIERFVKARGIVKAAAGEDNISFDSRERIVSLEKEMYAAAELLDFEKASVLRDRISELKGRLKQQDQS